jgi:chemotaxis protein histidine kinase CheA
MMRLSAIDATGGLLDALPVAFVAVDAVGEVVFASQLARELLGRHPRGDLLRAQLGPAYAELVVAVQQGTSPGGRWRELELEIRPGEQKTMAVRSLAFEDDESRRGAVVVLQDVSVELGLHRRYKAILQRQEAINDELRARIAEVLREHEDDLAVFGELVQVAPSIFASFVREAEAAIRAVRALGDDPSEELITAALREAHTLKGNARGLGLNAIAGRAHAVEEVIARAHRVGGRARGSELLAAVADVERAIARAMALRGGWSGGGASAAETRVAALDGAADLLAHAVTSLPPDHPVREQVARALAVVEEAASVPFAQLGEYLRAIVRTTAAASSREVPELLIEGGTLGIPARLHAILQTALPHLVRNAVVHGLEDAPGRLAARKPLAGRISLIAKLLPAGLEVLVADDGRGLDHARLLASAEAQGMRVNASTPLCDLLFAPGVSTASHLDLDAGRGMGASAARARVLEAGGTLECTSVPGRGTRFLIRLPFARGKPA